MVPVPDPEEDALLCALLARVGRGERPALAELYDRTVARVYAVACSAAGDPGHAEALTEEVYWQAWRQALRFDRRHSTAITWLLGFLPASTAGSSQPASVQAALDQLEPLPRQLLSLALQRGLTHDEISAQTRLPLVTVKTEIRRAQAALRALMGAQPQGQEVAR